MQNYLTAQFENGNGEELPLVYNIADDGTSVEKAVVDAEVC